ncbi:MAG: hypothetical protein R3Y43_08520 [Alphaproteobacteria bacterium]
MARKSKTILLFFTLIAFFAMFFHIQKSNASTGVVENAAPGTAGSTAHVCTQSGSTWTCMYDGTPYTWNVNDKGKVESDMLLGNCKPLPDRISAFSKCLFCPLFMALFNSVQDLSSASFSTLAPYIQIVISVAFGLWILFATLPVVASLSKQDAPKYIANLLKQTFVFAICYFLLESPDQIYYWVVDTVLITGMDFSKSFLFGVDTTSLSPTYLNGDSVYPSEGLIGTDVAESLDTLLQAIQAEIGFLTAIASTSICVGLKSFTIMLFLNGLIFYFLTLFLLISFGFYLTDAIIQLGIFGALMPFFIATFPFKLTKNFPKTGFNILMNSFFIFLIMGVVISIDVTLILQSLVSASAGGYSGDPKVRIFTAFQENNVDEIASIFDVSAAGGVGIIACIILAFKFTEQASKIADKYSDGGGLVQGMGAKIGGMAAGAATKGAKTAVKAADIATAPVRKAAKEKISKAVGNTRIARKAKVAAHKINKKVNETKNNIKSGVNKAKNSVKSGVNRVKNNIANSSVGQKAQKMTQKAKIAANKAYDKTTSLAAGALDKADNLAEKSGAKAAIKSVKSMGNKVHKVAHKAKNKVKDALYLDTDDNGGNNA